MRKVAAGIVLLIFFAGISGEERVIESSIATKVNKETINMESINSRVSTLDSLLIEVNKEYNGSKKKY